MDPRPPTDGEDPTIDDDPTDEALVEFDATATLRARRPAGPHGAAPAMAYAVHTHTCTYILDDGGVCRQIVAKQGAVPPHVMQCVGAQFVACLDLEEEGGLVAELRPGAMGLFVRHNEPGRMVLLRTAPIAAVDGRDRTGPGTQPPPAYGGRAVHEGIQYGKMAGVPVADRPSFFAVRTWGSEQTVTVSPSIGHDPGDEDDEP